MKKKIKIKYLYPGVEKIQKIQIGDWIDLRAAEETRVWKDHSYLLHLGVAMQLPKGYEAVVVARSSTFKNFGLIQTNAVGVIDNSYCGDSDEWRYPCYATRDATIPKNARICQFRIQKNQPKLVIQEVDHLSEKSRGGFGTTGTE